MSQRLPPSQTLKSSPPGEHWLTLVMTVENIIVLSIWMVDNKIISGSTWLALTIVPDSDLFRRRSLTSTKYDSLFSSYFDHLPFKSPFMEVEVIFL